MALLPRHVWGLPHSRWNYIGDEDGERHRLTLSFGRISIAISCFERRERRCCLAFSYILQSVLSIENALVTLLIARAMLWYQAFLSGMNLSYDYICFASSSLVLLLSFSFVLAKRVYQSITIVTDMFYPQRHGQIPLDNPSNRLPALTEPRTRSSIRPRPHTASPPLRRTKFRLHETALPLP